ncbi:MAG: tetratricopeptide repeat protein [Gammaproteobacteria bacterium]|nr:tetratricopeptide repeat protein [Gammaproteobacteria bacterium]
MLPFVNESGDKDQQYFSDGLSEDLITTLSQFTGLKVINRDSSFRFRNSTDSVQTIAAKLGVAHLLEGSVQRAGGEVRVSVELVNTADGSTLWSQRYDKPYKDLFALQDDITNAVAGALQIKLLAAPGAVAQSDRPPSGNLAAYNDFLQGKFYEQRTSEAGTRKAIDYFTDAIRLDPRYALAWVDLGTAYATLASDYVGGSEATAAWHSALAANHTALALDPDLATAHSSYSMILASHDHEWMSAEAEAQRANQLAPDRDFAALAIIYAALGHTQRAIKLLRQGLPNDPLCAGCYMRLAAYLAAQGRFDEAAEAVRKSLHLAPMALPFQVMLVKIEVMRSDASAALKAAQQMPPGVWRDGAIAFALQLGSNRAAADAALQAVIVKQAGFNAYWIAEIYALRRDPVHMFKWLGRANEIRDPGVQMLLTDPWILRYKNDPRFAAFCKQVGLPDTTDAKALP